MIWSLGTEKEFSIIEDANLLRIKKTTILGR